MTLGLVHAIVQIVNYSLPKWQAVQLTLHPGGGGGGGTAIMGYIGMCQSERYGFQAVYSRIGYINQNIKFWV